MKAIDPDDLDAPSKMRCDLPHVSRVSQPEQSASGIRVPKGVVHVLFWIGAVALCLVVWMAALRVFAALAD